MVQILLLTGMLTGLSACSLLNLSSSGHRTYDADQELSQYYSDKRQEERNRARTQLGRPSAKSDDPQLDARITLNRLERQISTKNEKALYYKYKPYIPDDNARIDFLRTQSYEAKSEWLRRKKITTEVFEYPKIIQDLINNNDICLGMTRQAVQESWGEPDVKEVAGDPMYGNERWKYSTSVSTENGFNQETRYVFFDGGLVSGWEKQ
ncbi:MAG: hypothetical protein A4S09_15625 [Proteobacteria bacterium SG_bin7]|nr:MAG: hypothetical protein A4S09_15625 [Proteobacteria bacterium SG_bin7]